MSKILKQQINQSADFESPIGVAIVDLMMAADDLRAQIERICAEFGITHSQYNVMRILQEAGADGHPRCEIVARTVERAPDVTRIVDRLEKQGLVMRDRSPEDKRLSVARLSEKGLELLAQIQLRFIEILGILAEKLSLVECIALSSICEKIYGKRS